MKRTAVSSWRFWRLGVPELVPARWASRKPILLRMLRIQWRAMLPQYWLCSRFSLAVSRLELSFSFAFLVLEIGESEYEFLAENLRR